MVPKGWEVRNLKDVVSFLDGKRKPIKSEDRSEMKGIYPYYGATGIIDWVNDYIFDDELILMGEDGENILSRNLPHVFCITGKSWVNNHAHVMKVNSGIDSYYLATYLESLDYRKYNSGSAQPKLNKTICEKIPVIFPPLPEQQKIANILSTWDKAISTTERLIDNSTQQKKALMQQLLTGKKRLLDDEGKRFEREWEESKLSEITDFIRDGTHGTHKRYESGIPMLSAKNITKQNTVDFDDAPYISEDDYNKIHARYTIKSGDILLTVVGTLGRVALVPDELAEKFTLQRSVAIIRVAKGICNQFLMQLFSSSDFTHLLHRKSNSTAQAGVYLGELGKLKILLPSFEEQQKIATVLTNADKEIKLLEQQLADLQQEKKALMQVLLTGKKRVVVDEC